jgi:hypothetical protein
MIRERLDQGEGDLSKPPLFFFNIFMAIKMAFFHHEYSIYVRILKISYTLISQNQNFILKKTRSYFNYNFF